MSDFYIFCSGNPFIISKGKFWAHMGFTDEKRNWLFPEEALFLIEAVSITLISLTIKVHFIKIWIFSKHHLITVMFYIKKQIELWL